MGLTLTAKGPVYPKPDQVPWRQQTVAASRQGCHWVAGVVDTTPGLQPAARHPETYRPVRAQWGWRSHRAQSGIQTGRARYQRVLVHGHPWTRGQVTKPACDRGWNRDDSLQAGAFSLHTRTGRVPGPCARPGRERCVDGPWQLGTAQLVHRHGRWCRHVPMTNDGAATDWAAMRPGVGLAFGLHFLVTAYDSQGQPPFLVNAPRAPFKIRRPTLPRRQTPSARRRLKR